MASVIIPHFCSILRFLGRPRLLTRLLVGQAARGRAAGTTGAQKRPVPGKVGKTPSVCHLYLTACVARP